MKQHLILIETRADGSRYLLPLEQAMLISANVGATYQVVDQHTGKVPEGLLINRKGDALEVQIDNDTVLQIKEFYSETVAAQFSNNDVLIQVVEDQSAGNIVGAASGDSGYGFGYGGDSDAGIYGAGDSGGSSSGFWTIGRIAGAGFAGLLGGAALSEVISGLSDDDYVPIDNTPPEPIAIPIINALAVDSGSSASDGITNDGTIRLTLAKDAFMWGYSLDGGETWIELEVDRSGGNVDEIEVSFELAEDTAYAEGQIRVHQTDKAGNVSEETFNTKAITTDMTIAKPNITLAEDTGKSTTDKITSNSTINVSLALDEPITKWEHSSNGGITWEKGNGTSFELSEGVYAANTIQVRQTDIAGNVGVNSNTSTIIIDNTITAAGITLATDSGSSATDFITNDATVNVALVTDIDFWEYSIDAGTNWKKVTNIETTSFELSANATYAKDDVQVRQTDLAGNTSIAKNSKAIVIDSIKPTLTLALEVDTGISTSDHISKNGTVIVTGLEAASWQYTLDGGAVWNTGIGETFVLAEGDYAANTIQVRQTDTAGNDSSIVSLPATTIDTTPPAAGVPVVNLLSTDDSTPIITGTATLAAGEYLTVEVGGAVYTNANANITVAGGNWSLDTGSATPVSGVFEPLTPGQYEVIASITDAAGNGVSDATSNELTITAANADPSIVVFDLMHDKSSTHSDRIFDSNIKYDIYILVDSTSKSLNFSGSNQWFGASNLSSDDKIWLVGNGSDIQGKNNGIITKSSALNPLNWSTDGGGRAAQLVMGGGFYRWNDGPGPTVTDLWSGMLVASNIPAIGYLTALPTAPVNILTT